MPFETHDTASEFATRYAATVAFVARFCVDGASVESTGSGCWAICGALANGLQVEVTNEQMDIDGPGQAFYIGLFDPEGGQVAAYADGELADQLIAAASLGADEAAALCRNRHGLVWLDTGPHTTGCRATGPVRPVARMFSTGRTGRTGWATPIFVTTVLKSAGSPVRPAPVRSTAVVSVRSVTADRCAIPRNATRPIPS